MTTQSVTLHCIINKMQGGWRIEAMHNRGDYVSRSLAQGLFRESWEFWNNELLTHLNLDLGTHEVVIEAWYNSGDYNSGVPAHWVMEKIRKLEESQ